MSGHIRYRSSMRLYVRYVWHMIDVFHACMAHQRARNTDKPFQRALSVLKSTYCLNACSKKWLCVCTACTKPLQTHVCPLACTAWQEERWQALHVVKHWKATTFRALKLCALVRGLRLEWSYTVDCKIGEGSSSIGMASADSSYKRFLPLFIILLFCLLRQQVVHHMATWSRSSAQVSSYEKPRQAKAYFPARNIFRYQVEVFQTEANLRVPLNNLNFQLERRRFVVLTQAA